MGLEKLGVVGGILRDWVAIPVAIVTLAAALLHPAADTIHEPRPASITA